MGNSTKLNKQEIICVTGGLYFIVSKQMVISHVYRKIANRSCIYDMAGSKYCWNSKQEKYIQEKCDKLCRELARKKLIELGEIED